MVLTVKQIEALYWVVQLGALPMRPESLAKATAR